MTKIDLLPYYSSKEGSFLDNLNSQSERTKQLFDETLYTLVGKMYEYKFEAERFDRCAFGKQIPIVPVSAHTKEGLAELLTLLSGLSQKYLEKKLEISTDETAKAAVLESKEEKGLGKTIDVILYQGTIKVNDEIAVLGKKGVITTKIRALLEPKPLQEMRMTKEKFTSVKSVSAACGIKISAPGLDDVLAGSTLTGIKTGNEVEELKLEFKETHYESQNKGLIIKADAIGSLEAMMSLLKKEGFVIRHADVGNVTRKDVMEACSLQCEDPLLGVILGFNVTIDVDAKDEAEKRGIKIFNENVIYHLIDNYRNWVEECKKLEKSKELSCLVWPVEFELIRGRVFRNTKPAIVGVKILEGRLREGWKVMNKAGEIIGTVQGIQNEGKALKEAKKGDEVAVAIDGANVGRNLDEGDKLYSCIPVSQYGDLMKYADDFTDSEKDLIQIIKKKRNEEEGAEE
jgi:translation initiation factor 5B